MRSQVSKIEDYPAYLQQCWQEHVQPKTKDAPTVISLFAGCGGSSLGYSMAGFRELLAVEWDKKASETFRLNFPGVPIYCRDIRKLSIVEVLKATGLQPGELDVLDGSPPCQGFSTAGKRDFGDIRNNLFREYIRLLCGLRPKAFILENVSGLIKGKMKLIFAEMLQEMRRSGYQVSARLMDTQYFGVPQRRQRIIVVGTRNSRRHLPDHPRAEYAPIASGKAISSINTKGKPLTPSAEKYWPQLKPGEAASKYHPKGHLFGLIKLNPNKPSPTLTCAAGAGKLVHWKHRRFIDISERSRLAAFPDSFKWVGTWTDIYNQQGNSAPPLFMYAIANHIKAEPKLL